MPNKEKIDDLIEMIQDIKEMKKTISSAPVLNGGFSRLEDAVKQTSLELKDLNHRLFEPDEGLYARVKETHFSIDLIQKELLSQKKTDEEHTTKIKEYENTIKSTEVLTKQLKEIGGERLEHIDSVVKLQKRFANIYWIFIASGLGITLKTLYDFYVSQTHR